jgi:hypothetical protein
MIAILFSLPSAWGGQNVSCGTQRVVRYDRGPDDPISTVADDKISRLKTILRS